MSMWFPGHNSLYVTNDSILCCSYRKVTILRLGQKHLTLNMIPIGMTSLKGVLSILAPQAQVLMFDSFQNGLISVSIRAFAFKDRIIAY